MFLFFIVIPLSVAICTTNNSVEQLSQNLDSMSVAFSKRDLPLLQKYYDRNLEILPCLREVVPPDVAAQYHLFMGLYLWVHREEELAHQSFSTVKQLDEQITIDHFLFPDGHSIHAEFADIEKASVDVVEQPKGYVFYFDGRQMNARPQGAPSIFQVERKGKLIFSVHLRADAAIQGPPFRYKAPSLTSFTFPFPYLLLGSSGLLMGGAQLTAHRFRTQEPTDALFLGNQILFFSSIASAASGGVLLWMNHRNKPEKTEEAS